MAKSNAIRIGVEDVYVAVGTQDPETGAVTYAAPKVFGGTATIGVTQEKGENKIYESNVQIRNHSRVSAANIAYESRTVDLDTEMEVLYDQAVAEAADGAYEDGPDDLPIAVAMGWAAPMSDGSYKCVWYYWCTASKGDESYETATESENSPTDRYDFAAMPRPDTKKLRRRKICKDKTERDAFFASVVPA